MKRKKFRKLQLSRQTVRTLSSSDLHAVVGGAGGYGFTHDVNVCIPTEASYCECDGGGGGGGGTAEA